MDDFQRIITIGSSIINLVTKAFQAASRGDYERADKLLGLTGLPHQEVTDNPEDAIGPIDSDNG